MGSLSVVSEARRARHMQEHGVFARFRYNDLKEAGPRLRWTRSLCKFNGEKERRGVVLRLCGGARSLTVGVRRQAVAKKDREEGG